MSQLRVGDIVVDGRNVSIGSTNLTGPAATPARPDGVVPLAGTDTRPKSGVWNVALALSGALVAAGGGWAFFSNAEPFSLTSYLFGGGIVASAGCGMIVLSGCLATLRRRQLGLAAERAALELAANAERLASILTSLGPEQTLNKLVADAGLPLPAVVRALAHLREHGELKEDLNTETGEWHYSVARPLATPELPKNLDGLLSDLERNARR
jgi:hypothetical protein